MFLSSTSKIRSALVRVRVRVRVRARARARVRARVRVRVQVVGAAVARDAHQVSRARALGADDVT